MEASSYSSNWRKLQGTLQTGLSLRKRKANESRRTIAPLSSKRARMGDTISKPDGEVAAHQSLRLSQSLSNDVTTASKSSLKLENTIRPDPTDKINGGITVGLNLGKFIAIDCEMVGVGPNPDDESVLARVSVVDFHGTQVYDSFVKPKEEITDYRTRVSGITPALLRQARNFEEVQKDIEMLLKNRILIGHAVKHDLAALMLGHPKMDIRDTSRYPAFKLLSEGRTPGLQKLAKQILNIDIQAGEHSSLEDARAAMALFRKEKSGFEAENRKRYGYKDKRKSIVETNQQNFRDENRVSDHEDKRDKVTGTKKKKGKKKKRNKR